MVTWVGLDHQRLGPGGRISHPVCRALGGAMLRGDRPFLVSRAVLEFAGRQAGGFWNDRYGFLPCVTWAGSFFPRWPLVRTPRNCDSTLCAPTRIVTSHGSSAVS